MSVSRDSAGTVLQSRTYMMDGLGNVIGSGLDGSVGAAILYDAWGNVETDSTAMMRLNTLRFGYKGMLCGTGVRVHFCRINDLGLVVKKCTLTLVPR